MNPTPQSADFKNFLREAEESGEDRREFTEANGKHWVYERLPELGIVRRVTCLESDGSVSYVMTTFGAADDRPTTYPAHALFVAGREVTIMAPAGVDDPLLSWEDVQDDDSLTRQIETALLEDGWAVPDAPANSAQPAMDAVGQMLGMRMSFRYFEHGKNKRMLTTIAKAGKPAGVALAPMPAASQSSGIPSDAR